MPRLIVVASVFFILGGTLFPYNFSWRNRRSLTNSFGLSKDIAARGNDLLIGVDGGLGQSFKGSVEDLRIYGRVLTAAEIAQGPRTDADLVLIRESALRFNGNREYVRIPNTPAIDITGRAITIALRLQLEGARQPVDQTILAKPWHSDSSGYPWYQYALEFDANDSRSVDFYFADTSGRPRGPFQVWPAIGRWTHVVFTYDGDLVRGYLDGQEKLSRPLESWERRDMVRNILLFMPLGFGLAGVIRKKAYSAAASVLGTASIAFLLSLTIEITQSLLPNRYSSLVDLTTNTIGAAAGGLCYLLVASSVRVKTRSC